VVAPASHTEVKLPKTDVLTLTIAVDGRVFFNMDGKYHRERLIKRMASRYGLVLDGEEIQRFALASSFGMPILELPNWLEKEGAAMKAFPMGGIPIGEENELIEWIVMARSVNPKVRIAVEGDKDTPYPMVGTVIRTLVDNNITRFSLVTEIERAPTQGSPETSS